jgi:hypothetical protein
MFGMSGALHFQTVLVGATNRDTFVSDINAGSGYYFDLGFLNIRFDKLHYTVVEGDTLTIDVLRCGNRGKCMTQQNDSRLENIVNFDTGDVISTDPRNQLKLTKLINKGYNALNQLTVEAGHGWYYEEEGLWLDPKQVSTAVERGQTYGGSEQRSKWVDSQYDFYGISDYGPESGEITFTPESGSLKQITVATTDDSLLEQPDEVAMIRLSLPGVWPSYGGGMWSTITILDDGDGVNVSPLASYSQKIHIGADSPEDIPSDVPTEQWPFKFAQKADFGAAVSVSDHRGCAAVGSPKKRMHFQTPDISGQVDRVEVGAVYMYARVASQWVLEQKLLPANGEAMRPYAHFGESVQVDGYLGNEMRVIIGAPGQAAAYIFIRTQAAYAAGVYPWTQEVRLSVPGVHKPEDRFGQENAVALHGDYAVVGAPGVEQVYLFQRNVTGWTQALVLRSSDYDYDRVLGIDYLHRADFGCSVSLSWRTLAVGAMRADYGNTG